MSTTDAQILSSQLATGVAEWLKQNTYFNNYFKSINDYLRIDVPFSELPALCVYWSGAPSTQNNSWNEVGNLAIDVMFSLKEQRGEKAKEIIEGLEMIRAQLLSNPVYIQKFVSQNYVPGLIKLNTNNNFNSLQDLRQKMLNAKNGALVFQFNMYYEINIYLNQRMAWANGKDFFSPKTDVYFPTEVDIKTNFI